MALADLRTLVDAQVRDESTVIAEADRNDAIGLAVVRYTEDRPRVIVVDTDAPGGQRLPLPAEWEDGGSRVIGIETPIGQIPPAHLASEDWQLYQGPVGEEVLLRQAVAAGADAVRWRITIAHVLDDTTNTVPLRDREAVACWAAALLLDELAAYYAGQRDTTIESDRVDWGSKSSDYAKRAAALRKRYMNHLGIEDKRSAPAGTVVTFRDQDSRGQDRLLRRRLPR
ncbi:hypothetical protein [Inquilinus sp. CA228]|uniref:hypothetical protein n=1 Tax=Inquilinus sp. CA228 TaxID=3455609 RepID=UPI003F8D5D25